MWLGHLVIGLLSPIVENYENQDQQKHLIHSEKTKLILSYEKLNLTNNVGDLFSYFIQVCKRTLTFVVYQGLNNYYKTIINENVFWGFRF